MPRTKQTARPWKAAKAKSAGVAKPVPRRSTASTGAGASAEAAALAAAVDAATDNVFGIGGALTRELHKAMQESSRTFMRVRAESGAVDLEALPAVLDLLDEATALVQRAYVKEKFKDGEFCDIWSRELDCKLMLGIHEHDESEYDPSAEPRFTLVDADGDFCEECTVTSSANGTIVDAAGYGILKIRGARESADWDTTLWMFTPTLLTRDPAMILREEGKEVVHCRQ